MRAAVWVDINKVELRDVKRPVPKAGEVLVRVEAVGICATELHMISGGLKLASPPCILGHEISGTVIETGEGVSEKNLGRRIVVDTIIACHECPQCLSGHPEHCVFAAEIGYPPYDGGYGEFVALPEYCLHDIPESISFEEGAIIESVICPAASLFKHPVVPGETVFIQGGGVAGLSYLQLAKAAGAGKVIISARGARIETARSLGADVIIDAKSEDVAARVLEETNGAGADLSIDAAGTTSSIPLAISAVRAGGRVILYGIPSDDDVIQFPVLDIIVKQLSVYGACGSPSAWDPLIKMIADGKIDLKPFVTNVFPIEDVEEAIRTVRERRGGAIKAVLKFN